MAGQNINEKNKENTSISPGPGMYKPKKFDSLSFSMGLKTASSINMNRKDMPGPSVYNPRPVFRLEGFTKFGNGVRKGMVDEKRLS